jgi:hypothetical protein
VRDLAEFLLARIAEDEQATAAGVQMPGFDRVRVLAESDAKRRIVGCYLDLQEPSFRLAWEEAEPTVIVAMEHTWVLAMRILASGYAAHSDYLKEWQP